MPGCVRWRRATHEERASSGTRRWPCARAGGDAGRLPGAGSPQAEQDGGGVVGDVRQRQLRGGAGLHDAGGQGLGRAERLEPAAALLGGPGDVVPVDVHAQAVAALLVEQLDLVAGAELDDDGRLPGTCGKGVEHRGRGAGGGGLAGGADGDVGGLGAGPGRDAQRDGGRSGGRVGQGEHPRAATAHRPGRWRPRRRVDRDVERVVRGGPGRGGGRVDRPAVQVHVRPDGARGVQGDLAAGWR